MEIIKKEAIVKKYNNENELSAMEKELLQAAHDATQTAYAPYSKFKVGCAILLENGVVIKGSNQENIAYPSGLCAERVAIFHAGATYPNVPIKMMAVTAKAIDYKVNEPVMPCGACLQSISEFELKFQTPICIILQGETGDIYVAEGTKTFMPFQFYIKELAGG